MEIDLNMRGTSDGSKQHSFTSNSNNSIYCYHYPVFKISKHLSKEG
jgi:hypothetical protein